MRRAFRFRDVLCISCALLTLAAAPAALSQNSNPAYLKSFPTVEQVRAQVHGANARETAARQMGAFWQLEQIVEGLAGPRYYRSPTPDENRLIAAYRNTYAQINTGVQSTLGPNDKADWFKQHGFYETDDAFRDELFRIFLTPQLEDQFLITTHQSRARVEARRQAYAAEQQAMAQRNAAAASAPALAPAQEAEAPPPCPVTATPARNKIPAHGNSRLLVHGTGYRVTHTERNTQTGAITNQWTREGNFDDTDLFLLDEDAELALREAGIGPGLLGSSLATFAMIEGVSKVGDSSFGPLLSGLSTALGQGDIVKEMSDTNKADFACGMKAIEAHTIAKSKTNGDAVGVFNDVPSGTYYLYARYAPVAVWNLRVELRPGANSVPLSVNNAAVK
ncbi:MAG TPA: hypothetical protein VG844_05495 [Terracidiphilus sp.]|nr:hypothetical protein [Terracidiphilus sp.]